MQYNLYFNNPHYFKTLKKIKDYVLDLLTENQKLYLDNPRLCSDPTLQYFYTPHDEEHCTNLEKLVLNVVPQNIFCLVRSLMQDKSIPLHEAYKLAQNKLKDKESVENNWLTEREVFILYCSIWLHDVGMIPYLFPDERASLKPIDRDRIENIRTVHHQRSKDYIDLIYLDIGLEKFEAESIKDVCFFHRKREKIDNCFDRPGVRVRLLAAYLRIMDAIDVSDRRLETYIHLLDNQKMPLEAKVHWVKSLWVEKVNVLPLSSTIEIRFKISKVQDAINRNIVSDLTIDELRQEIDSCKDVLAKEGLAYYSQIIPQYGLGLSSKEKLHFSEVVSRLRVQRTASANELAQIVIDTICDICRAAKKVQKVDRNASVEKFSLALDYYQTEEIGYLLSTRKSHILIRNIDQILTETKGSVWKFHDIHHALGKLKMERRKAIKKIGGLASELFSDLRPILLFGYSTTIVESLKLLDEKIKHNLEIFVCECSSKNQFNYNRTKLYYCDGKQYAIEISKAGFKKVNLIPDNSAGHYLHLNIVSKVLFGANIVDIVNGVIEHSGGHFTIIDSAHRNKIPIIVFADKFKFGLWTQHNIAERKIDWFAAPCVRIVVM